MDPTPMRIVPLVLVILSFVPPCTCVFSFAPWQSSLSKDSSVAEKKRYLDFPPTVFAPNGRLHVVEAAMEASSSSDDPTANAVVAIRCENGTEVILASIGTRSPYLDSDMIVSIEDDANTTDTNTTTSNTTSIQNATISARNESAQSTPSLLLPTKSHVSLLGPRLFGVTAGNAADSSILSEKLHQLATAIREEVGELSTVARLPPSILARRLADQLQRPTQNIFAGETLMVSSENSFCPVLLLLVLPCLYVHDVFRYVSLAYFSHDMYSVPPLLPRTINSLVP